MSQNSIRDSWDFDKVDKKLQGIMKNIHDNSYEASEKYGDKGNYVMGANIFGLSKSGKRNDFPRNCLINTYIFI